MIKIKGLSKSFGKKCLFEDINLNVSKGEIIGIVGPSGAGKSTFLRCINALEKPDAGSIEIAGTTYDLSSEDEKEIVSLRREMAMVFQQFNLFHKKTVTENVMEGLVIVQKKDKEKSREIAENELSKVGLLDYKDAYPAELSGGQQQRVAIARALALKPKLILFDEPTSALDPSLINEVLLVIKKVADEGNTMMIVSHEMNFIKKISDRICLVKDGQVLVSDLDEETEAKKEIEEFMTSQVINFD